MGYLLMKNYHVGASPGRNLCSCYEKACVEIKCPYSINYTILCYSNLEYLQLWDGMTLLKKSHKYYTQCMLQMAVTGTIKITLLFGIPIEFLLLKYILIMNSGVPWKINFKKIISIILKVCFQWERSHFYLGTLLFGIESQYQ